MSAYNKTLHLKGKKCSGGKLSKVCLTGLAAGNAYGERLQMFVIGKSIKPRCFKRYEDFALSIPGSTQKLDVWRAF